MSEGSHGLTRRRHVCASIALLAIGCLTLGAGPAGPSGLRFTRLLGFKLGEGTLQDVRNRLGDALLMETGDAGEYEASVRYYLLEPAILVTFLSSEMGGREHDLLGFEVRQAAATRSGCALATLSGARLVPTAGGLRLGMNRAQLDRLMQSTSDRSIDTVSRVFEFRQRLGGNRLERLKPLHPEVASDPFVNVQITVTARFSGDSLVQFSVWRAEDFCA